MKMLERKSQSGMAMLMALITMVVLTILAGELVYQSGVYSSLVFRQRDQLRATLLARSGLRLGLLQLKAAKKAKAKAKNIGLGDNAAITDKIWQTPLVLPPPPLPGLSQIDTSALDGFKKSLGIEGSIAVTIVGENGHASLNGLVWPTGKIKGVTGGDETNPDGTLKKPTDTSAAPMDPEQKKEQMKKNREGYVELFDAMLEKKRQSDDGFRNKYPSLNGEYLVGNLLAWMDPETKVDGENRDKYDYYNNAPTPYALKNAPIATESEFHMIKGIDEVISKMISDNFTVQASNSLDVNKASLLLIHAYIPELKDDDLDEIGKRRTDETKGGAFKDAADFWAFLTNLGGTYYDEAKKRLTERGVKILEPETSYRVVVVGQSGVATKTWVANVGPLPPKVESAKPQPGERPPPPPPPPDPSNSTSTSTSTSTETSDADSLNIVYLKSD